MSARDPSDGFFALVARGLRKRCPRCGARAPFTGWGEMADWCQRCGLAFEREEGYWVGAMIINTAVTFGVFLAVFVGGMVITWPDVPWTGLLVASMAVMLVTPVLFYPRSKTVWLAVELSYHRLEPAEREAAAARVRQP